TGVPEEGYVSTAMKPTLRGEDYRSPAIYDADLESVFHRRWCYVGRSERLAHVGDRLVIDVGAESVLVLRNRDGDLQAYYNVCRHRGSQLCDASGSGFGAAITCPYHAWSYSLDGELVATPNVAKEELDRMAFPLHRVAVESWQGMLFVSLATDPPPLVDWLAEHSDEILSFERLQLDRLRLGRLETSTVAANWKILVENYAECLHCPQIHPELVEIIPLHQQGDVIDEGRNDGGAWLAEGANSFTADGTAPLPVIATMTPDDARSYLSAFVYPNLFVDITGTSVILTRLIPRGPARTDYEIEYLFEPSAVESDDFDPSAVCDFSNLVLAQDNAVCERTQRGVSSRSFDRGMFAARDSLCWDFTQQYLADLAAES
ncbi:MAG: aromatic ring-hydroxylating dioxygenase subunit alpha, partial [Actinomycetota bacterium]|nr:aromatic ring-hydroxylating dioxygenase subunit alpha [Actinomycetota bacterium]MED6329114.1 aromatic ring-hydroxylating dioxygenase subunit alpha [Actinomycetota bacterium]